ncbi:MAG: peptide deformylase [Bacteroidales bacterium]|nr:peptide deformylase [Bacteroidales bacterium]MDD3843754.1 peptide deformylase [Bacteroidales bacterium]MDD4618398.1 peptide deformylase [Bacteroidales bacterium]
MILPIYVYGAEVLRQKAVDVDLSEPGIKEDIAKLVSDMWETMEKADGVGFAAPQIGRSIRLLIVDGSMLSEDVPELENFKRTIINPVLLEESKEMSEYSEGCLSIPDIHADVQRPKKIKIKYVNDSFQEVTEEFDNFACRMVQHEMDHLDGILFTDRTAPIRKKMLQSKLNGIKAGKVRTSYKVARL